MMEYRLKWVDYLSLPQLVIHSPLVGYLVHVELISCAEQVEIDLLKKYCMVQFWIRLSMEI